jgi:hypothetical protein
VPKPAQLPAPCSLSASTGKPLRAPLLLPLNHAASAQGEPRRHLLCETTTPFVHLTGAIRRREWWIQSRHRCGPHPSVITTPFVPLRRFSDTSPPLPRTVLQESPPSTAGHRDGAIVREHHRPLELCPSSSPRRLGRFPTPSPCPASTLCHTDAWTVNADGRATWAAAGPRSQAHSILWPIARARPPRR